MTTVSEAFAEWSSEQTKCLHLHLRGDRISGQVKCSDCGAVNPELDQGTTKPTNPKDAIGSSKVPVFSVVPQRVIAELGLALLEGAAKYRRHNYRAAGVRASVYMDATGRHLGAWWEGQDLDPDSGLSHVTKAIASLTVLRDSMLQGNWQDDRPPRVSDPDWVRGMNAAAVQVLAKYPEPKPPCTELDLTRPIGCTEHHGADATCPGCPPALHCKSCGSQLGGQCQDC